MGGIVIERLDACDMVCFSSGVRQHWVEFWMAYCGIADARNGYHDLCPGTPFQFDSSYLDTLSMSHI